MDKIEQLKFCIQTDTEPNEVHKKEFHIPYFHIRLKKLSPRMRPYFLALTCGFFVGIHSVYIDEINDGRTLIIEIKLPSLTDFPEGFETNLDEFWTSLAMCCNCSSMVGGEFPLVRDTDDKNEGKEMIFACIECRHINIKPFALLSTEQNCPHFQDFIPYFVEVCASNDPSTEQKTTEGRETKTTNSDSPKSNDENESYHGDHDDTENDDENNSHSNVESDLNQLSPISRYQYEHDLRMNNDNDDENNHFQQTHKVGHKRRYCSSPKSMELITNGWQQHCKKQKRAL